MLQLNVDVLLEMVNRSDVFQTVGTVHSADSLVTVRMPAAIGQLCQIEASGRPDSLAEVIGFRGETSQIMTFAPLEQLRHGDRVRSLGRRPRFPAGPGLLGRVIDCLGRPMDGQGPLVEIQWREHAVQTPGPMSRRPIQRVLPTGQKAIDTLLTLGEGQRVGLFAGSGVGKSTLLGEIARYAESDLNVVALVGERGREVRPFLEEALGADGLARSVVVVALADETPLARVRAGETAVAIAEDFRAGGVRVMLLFDSLTRWCMAQRELGLMLGEPPTSRGYTPGVMQKLAVLLERLGNDDRGSITALLTVLVEGDDVNDPVADSARSVLDGHIVLTRELAAQGHFPAIDVGQSISRVFLDICHPEKQRVARAARQVLTRFRQTEDLIQVGAWQRGNSAETDLAVDLFQPVMKFLEQPIRNPVSMRDADVLLAKTVTPWLSAGH